MKNCEQTGGRIASREGKRKKNATVFVSEARSMRRDEKIDKCVGFSSNVPCLNNEARREKPTHSVSF